MSKTTRKWLGLTRFDDSSGTDKESLEQKARTPILLWKRESGRRDVKAGRMRRRLGPGRERHEYRAVAVVKESAIEGSRRVNIWFIFFEPRFRPEEKRYLHSLIHVLSIYPSPLIHNKALIWISVIIFILFALRFLYVFVTENIYSIAKKTYFYSQLIF